MRNRHRWRRLAWQMVCLLVVSVSTGLVSVRASTLDIEVRHTFGGDSLLLDSLRYQNVAGETLSVTRLSYLLGGFALEREDGTWLEFPDVFAWMDAATHRTSMRLPDVPPASYRALRFHVGPNAAANAADPAHWAADHPLNPNLDGLYWGWQGGYVFLALEGHFRPENPASPSGYAYHLARDPNRTGVNLAATLDLTHDAGLLLDFDLAALLNSPRPLSFARDGTATHSRDGDPVAAALVANLPAAFRVRQVVSTTPAISLPTTVRPLYLPERFTPYRFVINKTFPIPELPRDNPLLVERVALGKKLFQEPALSRDGSVSCQSCHQPNAGYSDRHRFSAGVEGKLGRRHAMSLTNLAWKSNFFWDGRASSLRTQVLVPLQDHLEMDQSLEHVVAVLATNPAYPALFQAAFGSPEITAEKLGLALENYLLTLMSCHAKFDGVLRGQEVFTPQEQLGFELFMTEYEPRSGQRGADCFHCHGGPLFTDHQFHNNGLAQAVDGDPGRFGVTSLESDRDKFMTPSLRNVLLRPPYMHDGRFDTLEEVVAHYDHGVQRSDTLDPNLAKHPSDGLRLTAKDQDALIAFLKTLTDR